MFIWLHELHSPFKVKLFHGRAYVLKYLTQFLVTGTILGCIMSYIMMEQITTERREILLAIQGTNVWSGQHVQSHNAAVSLPPKVACHLGVRRLTRAYRQ
jgi:hypothetical protein